MLRISAAAVLMAARHRQTAFFFAGVLVVAAVGFAAASGYGRMSATGDSSSDLQVTEEEVKGALRSLQSDATFAALTADTTWDVIERLPNLDRDTGAKAGIALVIVLAAPAASSGPWKNLYCQATVVQTFEFPYTGISILGAVFAPSGKLVSLRPLPSPTLAYPPDAEFPPTPDCFPGTEDGEN